MIALLLLACVGDAPSVDWPDADPARFDAEVQPVLSARCANPACHGAPGRPLEVYAPGLHRLDPDDRFMGLPLTDEERALNLARAAAFLVDITHASDSALLCKPLDERAGGCGHAGGVQLEDTAEPAYQALYGWVEEGIR